MANSLLTKTQGMLFSHTTHVMLCLIVCLCVREVVHSAPVAVAEKIYNGKTAANEEVEILTLKVSSLTFQLEKLVQY